jgi:hypothetical protein
VVFCHISKRGSKKQQKINKRCCILIAGNNLAWASTNSAPDERRGATVGIVLTLTDLAGIFCSYRFAPFSLNSTSLAPRVLTGSSTIGVLIGQIHPTKDAPRYTFGNAWTFGVVMAGLILFCVASRIYKRRKAEKERRTAAGKVMPSDEWKDQALDYPPYIEV